MRCPKCGYISFDRQRSCGKCSNDLTAVAEQLQGTAGTAAAPFFLGAVLGKKTPAYDEPGPVLHEEEEEETLALDEFEADTLQPDEEELDFTGPPLNDSDLEEQALPSLGLEDIDVSDLVPPQEEKEGLALSLGSEQEAALQRSAQEEDDSLMGMEMPSLEADDLLSVDEKEAVLSGSFEGETPDFRGSDEEEGDEIIDLSSLMNFEAPSPNPADTEKDRDFLGLSLEDEPDELHLSLDDGGDDSAPAEAPEKPATAMADIPDLGLTLENDDR